jgi:formate C-acetyltransferase
MNYSAWEGFQDGNWKVEIDVRNFIQTNYTPYEGKEDFLAGPTARTKDLMKKLNHLFELEQEFGGVLDIDTQTVSSLTSYPPGYLDREREIIAGPSEEESIRSADSI